MPAVVIQHGPIQIDWEDDGHVVVLDRDRHRFLMTMQQAADACAAGKMQMVWKEEFDNMLRRIHTWAKDRAGIVAAAYLAVVDRQIVFFIVPTSHSMDFALNDEIAQLEVELVQDFGNCRCEVRQIPGRTVDALSTFLNLDGAVLLYGKSPAA